MLTPAKLLPPLVLLGLGLGVGEGLGLGVGLGLGNQVAISTRGGNNLARAENGHNNGRLVTVPLTAKYITLSSVKVQKSIKHIARILHLPSVVQS